MRIVRRKMGEVVPHVWGQFIIGDDIYTEEKNRARAESWLKARTLRGETSQEWFNAHLPTPKFAPLSNDAILIVWEEDDNEFGPVSP